MWNEFLSKADSRRIKLTYSLLFDEKINTSDKNKHITKKDILCINNQLSSLQSPFKVINGELTFTESIANTQQTKQKIYYNLCEQYYQNTTSLNFIKQLLLHPGCSIEAMTEYIFVSLPYIYFLKNKVNDMAVLKNNNLVVVIINNELFLKGNPTTIGFFILDFFKSIYSTNTDLYEVALEQNIHSNYQVPIPRDIYSVGPLLFKKQEITTDKSMFISLLKTYYNQPQNAISREIDLTKYKHNPYVIFFENSFNLLKDNYTTLNNQSHQIYFRNLTLSYLLFSLSHKYYPSFLLSSIGNSDKEMIHNRNLITTFKNDLLPIIPTDQRLTCLLFFNHISGLLEFGSDHESINLFINLIEPPYLELFVKKTIRKTFGNESVHFVDSIIEADAIISSSTDVFDNSLSDNRIYFSKDFFNEVVNRDYLIFIATMIKTTN
ncbi:hypothetical protein G7081_07055 [Vagococcus coleopterorum]|uniref:Uncharacterized protein n=1 Tax=Vagococcus coleopterorum TaxID=2714946 RepID=A0A6G8AP36_9ENTE|nr:hypothetical protein [Vagococcus coleopterorum]QIL46844.1 hypothetical protein G7081_07055 [Vagococcus coleopterorum]